MAAGNSQGHTQAAILKAWLYIDQGFIKARSSFRSGISLSKEMHEKGDRRPWDMGGGSVRAGRGAARSWERQRRTGTGLAVTALAVLGTLLVIREHRRGTDVAPSTADKAAPGAADAGVGCCEHAINPAGGEEVRQGWFGQCLSALSWLIGGRRSLWIGSTLPHRCGSIEVVARSPFPAL